MKGDVVRELASVDLGGRPAAAVKDCAQRLGEYLRFKSAGAKALLRAAGVKHNTCVFNRGVLLQDARALLSPCCKSVIASLC